jgi:hypothetical protein
MRLGAKIQPFVQGFTIQFGSNRPTDVDKK